MLETYSGIKCPAIQHPAATSSTSDWKIRQRSSSTSLTCTTEKYVKSKVGGWWVKVYEQLPHAWNCTVNSMQKMTSNPVRRMRSCGWAITILSFGKTTPRCVPLRVYWTCTATTSRLRSSTDLFDFASPSLKEEARLQANNMTLQP